MNRLGPLVAVAALAAGAAYWLWSGDAADRLGAQLAELTVEASRLHAEGDYEGSSELYRQAEQLALDAGDETAALSARAQGGVCLKMMDRLDAARDKLEPVLRRSRELGVARLEGLALGNLARVETMAGNVDLALEYMQQLVVFSEEHADERTEILTREQIAVSLDRLGRYDQALRVFDEALERQAVLDLGEDDRRDALLRQKGWTLVRLGDDFGATETWAQADAAPTTLAHQARQLSMMGLHAEAAESALAAARLFEEEVGRQDGSRDAALALSLSELLMSGQLEACRTELDAVLGRASDAASRAPFELVRARLELTEGRAAEAAVHARAARAGFGGVLDEQGALDGQGALDEPATLDQPATFDQQAAGWIEAVALVKAAQPEQALTVLMALPDSLARTVLHGWILDVLPDESQLASELLPRLDPARVHGGDLSLGILRRLCPEPLPSLAWLSLHLALADADRLRARDHDDVADAVVSSGISDALHWHAAETLMRLTGRWPDPSRADNSARVNRWRNNQLAPDEAVIAVLPGVRLSYLVIFTSELGGTTFGLPPGKVLHAASEAVVTSLRGGRLHEVAHAAYELFDRVFDAPALEDLAGRTRWTMMLPDELTSVPPAMWVTQRPEPDAPVAWLLRSHEPSLMPLVLPVGFRAPAASPDTAPPASTAGLEHGRWVRMGLPTLDPSGLSLAAGFVQGVYGDDALSSPGSLREGSPPLSGDALTVPAVMEELAIADVVELSVPGFGGERLGGLFLAPDPSAARADAAAGFLPWRRIAESAMGANVILDRTRFDPSDTEHGAAYAASALLWAGGQQVLMTRWPVPAALRDSMVERIEAGADGTRSLAQLTAHSQRLFVAGAEQAGLLDRTHPLFWGGWLPFDVGP